MADVKWIKITTDIFDDEKVLMIESLPSADSIIVIWFKLLALAGKQNNSGVFIMNNRIPYTEEMLASIFRREINTVRLALTTFEKYGMIDIIDDVITIPNWGKHQNLEQIQARRDYKKEWQREYRKKQKLLIQNQEDGGSERGCPQGQNVHSLEEDKERDIDKEINNSIISDSDEPKPPKKVKHKYGEYKNVLLTDEELEKLKEEYPDYLDRIERLSSYVESTGKKYKSHYATIRNWARNDKKPKTEKVYEDFNVEEW